MSEEKKENLIEHETADDEYRGDPEILKSNADENSYD